MAYQTYEEVSYLDTAAQRQLLQQGDAVERVWAAWALGIALGAQSTPELISGLHESPASGTRRNLLVILAGFGEREVLHAFAQVDPDEYVRATACQYLIRIDPNAGLTIDPFIRDRLLSDPSAIVRQAILAERAMSLPVFQFEDLARLANDNDVEVRRLATERLLATQPVERLFPGILEDRIPHEPNADLRRQLLVQCLKAEGSRRLLALSRTVPAHLTSEILNFLVKSEVRVEWEALAPLSVAQDPTWDILLIRLMHATDTPRALPWLLHGMVRATHWPQPRNRPEAKVANAVHTFAYSAEESLFAALPQLQEIHGKRLELQDVQAATAYLQHEIEQLEGSRWDEWDTDDEADMDLAWYEQAVNKRRQLIELLERAG